MLRSMSNTDVQTPRWTLGEHLRKAREGAGLSQQDLADKLGLSRRSVTTYERDEVVPKHTTLKKWALCCEVPLDWLVNAYIDQQFRTTAQSWGALFDASNRSPQPLTKAVA